MHSVSVHLLVHPNNTKTNLVRPVAKSVPVEDTVLPVPLVVHTHQQVVQLVPIIKYSLTQCVILVPVGNTTTSLVKLVRRVVKDVLLDGTNVSPDNPDVHLVMYLKNYKCIC